MTSDVTVGMAKRDANPKRASESKRLKNTLNTDPAPGLAFVQACAIYALDTVAVRSGCSGPGTVMNYLRSLCTCETLSVYSKRQYTIKNHLIQKECGIVARPVLGIRTPSYPEWRTAVVEVEENEIKLLRVRRRGLLATREEGQGS